MKKYYIIAIVVILIGAATWTEYNYLQKNKDKIKEMPEQTKDNLIDVDETANWKIYRNDQYGIQLKYPQDWTVVENFTDSKSFVLFVAPEMRNDFYNYFLSFGIKNKEEDKILSNNRYNGNNRYDNAESFMKEGDSVKIGSLNVKTTEIIKQGKCKAILYSNKIGQGSVEINKFDIEAELDYIEGNYDPSAEDEDFDLKQLPEYIKSNQILSTLKFIKN